MACDVIGHVLPRRVGLRVSPGGVGWGSVIGLSGVGGGEEYRNH